MAWTITEFVLNLGEYIKGLSLIIGILVGLFVIYKWYYDRENQKKATFFTIFVICHEIIELIDNHDLLGDDQTRLLFAYISKTLNTLVFDYNSIIYFNRTEDLLIFLSLKRDIEREFEIIQTRSWAALKDRFKSEEFKEIKKTAEFLLDICKEEVKSLKEI